MRHRRDGDYNGNFSEPRNADGSSSEECSTGEDEPALDREYEEIMREWDQKFDNYNKAGMPFGSAGFEFWVHFKCDASLN